MKKLQKTLLILQIITVAVPLVAMAFEWLADQVDKEGNALDE